MWVTQSVQPKDEREHEERDAEHHERQAEPKLGRLGFEGLVQHEGDQSQAQQDEFNDKQYVSRLHQSADEQDDGAAKEQWHAEVPQRLLGPVEVIVVVAGRLLVFQGLVARGFLYVRKPCHEHRVQGFAVCDLPATGRGCHFGGPFARGRITLFQSVNVQKAVLLCLFLLYHKMQ